MQEVSIKSNPKSVQLALCLAVFLVPYMGSSLNLALPRIVDDFSMPAFSLTFVVSLYLVATAMFQMPAARLADLIGKRRVFLMGLGIFGLFCLLGGMAWSGTALIVSRFFCGVGSALAYATNMAILTSVFPKEKRGQALGINTAVVYFAVATGPFLGGQLAHYFGWRSIFFSSAALTALAIGAALYSIKDEWVDAKGESFDYGGGTTYILAIAAIVMGFSHLPLPTGWALLAAGLAGAAFFVRLERRTAYPLLQTDVFFHNRHFRLASLSAMINYSASFAIGFILSLYLQYVVGMSANHAGFVLIAQPVVQSILSPVGGWLSDRVNPSILTTTGMGCISVGLFLLSRLTPDTPIMHVVYILILVGIGFALFSSPNVNIIMGSVSRRLSGLASATTGTARQLGQSLSIAMTSLIIHHFMGNGELSRANAHLFLPAMQWGFLLFGGICLVGMYTSASKLFGEDRNKEWRHVSGRFPPPDGSDDTGTEL